MPVGKAEASNTQWMAEGAVWVMVLVGIALAIAAGRETASLLAAPQTWVKAEARVVRTTVREVRYRAPLSMRETVEGYQVVHELVYFRQGSRYQEAVPLGYYPTRAEAQSALRAAAQPGTAMTIWVDASNPMRVRLEPAVAFVDWKQAPASLLKLAMNLRPAPQP